MFIITVQDNGSITVETESESYNLQQLDDFGLDVAHTALMLAIEGIEARQQVSEPEPKPKKTRKRRKSRNGTKYAYKGETFNSKTALGRILSPEAKYPHKAVDSLIEKGEVEVIEAEKE